VNLALYLKVLRRHRLLVASGVALAIALAFLSMARVSLAKGVQVTYRSPEIFQAKEMLLVSTTGFPWGRATPTVGDATKPDPAGAVAAQSRLTSIAVLYAQLANSDPVRNILLRDGFVRRKDISALPVIQSYSSVGPLLPLIEIEGNGSSKATAISHARRATNAFLEYLREQQVDAKIPPEQRVIVQPLNSASTAQLVQGRKKTMSVLVFMVVLLGACVTALIRDNLQQNTPVAEPASDIVQLRRESAVP
jgi:hypothetical protein